MSQIQLFLVLLVVYQVKHFVCDYILQGKYMLGKFLPYPAYILPLLAHTLVHAVATFGIAYLVRDVYFAVGLSLLDMGTHFLVDRIKASPDMLGRFKNFSGREYRAMMGGGLPYGFADSGNFKETVVLSDAEVKARFKSNTFYYWALGADQAAHHLTHYLIIAALVLL